MPKSLPLLLLLAATAAANSTSNSNNNIERRNYSGYRVLRLDAESPLEALSLLNELEVDDGFKKWSLDLAGGTLDVTAPPSSDVTELLETRAAKVVVEDVEELFEKERRAIETRRREFQRLKSERPPSNRAVEFDLETYHRHDEINQYMRDLEAEYDTVSTEVIGPTYEGREMVILKFCQSECGNNPIMWVDSGIHANEWIGPASNLYLMDTLIQSLPEEEEDLLGIDWYFLPIFNADGYEFTWDVDRDWRKTRRILEEVDTICVGVDPNRNFGYFWGEGEPGDFGGASKDPCSINYQSSAPWTEPEVVNVRDYINNMSPKPVFYQNMHSDARMILYPLGYTCDTSANPDFDDQDALATKGNDAVTEINGNSYLVGDICNTIYQAAGNAVDWAYGDQGIKYAYTMEMRPGSDGGGMVVPEEEILEQALEMYAFHVSAARDIMAEFGN